MTAEQKTYVAEGRLKSLADRLADARIVYDEASDVKSKAEAIYDERQEELFAALEDAGLSQIRTERGLFSANDLAWAKVEDEEAARQWAELHAPELLTLNRQRLSVIVRKVIRGEEDAPGVIPGQTPPGVKFTTSRKITWRRT